MDKKFSTLNNYFKYNILLFNCSSISNSSNQLCSINSFIKFRSLTTFTNRKDLNNTSDRYLVYNDDIKNILKTPFDNLVNAVIGSPDISCKIFIYELIWFNLTFNLISPDKFGFFLNY